MVNELKYKKELEHLRMVHQSLESEIAALIRLRVVDQVKVQSFKKKKLKVKEMINSLESMLMGDIVA
jgi:hypothetical protein